MFADLSTRVDERRNSFFALVSLNLTVLHRAFASETYSEKVPLGFRFRTPFLLRLCLCCWTETQQFTRIHATKGALIEFDDLLFDNDWFVSW